MDDGFDLVHGGAHGAEVAQVADVRFVEVGVFFESKTAHLVAALEQMTANWSANGTASAGDEHASGLGAVCHIVSTD